MDNFDLRKFLAESRQQEQSLVSEALPDPHAQDPHNHYGMPADFKPPGQKEAADGAMEEQDGTAAAIVAPRLVD